MQAMQMKMLPAMQRGLDADSLSKICRPEFYNATQVQA